MTPADVAAELETAAEEDAAELCEDAEASLSELRLGTVAEVSD